MRTLNYRQLQLIANYLGYTFVEENVTTDSKEMKVETIYSKIPIIIEVFKDEKDSSLDQKYFKDVPNPDFGRSADDPIQDDHVPIRWNTELEKISWGTLNYAEYVTAEWFDRYLHDIGAQLEILEALKNDYQLVMNSEKVAIYHKTSMHYIAEHDSQWREGLFNLILKFIMYQNSIAKTVTANDIDDDISF